MITPNKAKTLSDAQLAYELTDLRDVVDCQEEMARAGYTPEKLGQSRAYVFLGAFVAGMLLTPPDVISQTLLAVPIYLLYEGGIIMARLTVKEKQDE